MSNFEQYDEPADETEFSGSDEDLELQPGGTPIPGRSLPEEIRRFSGRRLFNERKLTDDDFRVQGYPDWPLLTAHDAPFEYQQVASYFRNQASYLNNPSDHNNWNPIGIQLSDSESNWNPIGWLLGKPYNAYKKYGPVIYEAMKQKFLIRQEVGVYHGCESWVEFLTDWDHKHEELHRKALDSLFAEIVANDRTMDEVSFIIKYNGNNESTLSSSSSTALTSTMIIQPPDTVQTKSSMIECIKLYFHLCVQKVFVPPIQAAKKLRQYFDETNEYFKWISTFLLILLCVTTLLGHVKHHLYGYKSLLLSAAVCFASAAYTTYKDALTTLSELLVQVCTICCTIHICLGFPTHISAFVILALICCFKKVPTWMRVAVATFLTVDVFCVVQQGPQKLALMCLGTCVLGVLAGRRATFSVIGLASFALIAFSFLVLN